MSYTWDSWREGDDPPEDINWTPKPISKLEKIIDGIGNVFIFGGIVGGTIYGAYKLVEYIANL